MTDDHTEESGDQKATGEPTNKDKRESERPVGNNGEATDEEGESSLDDEPRQSAGSDDTGGGEDETKEQSDNQESSDEPSEETRTEGRELREELAATRERVDDLETKVEDYRRRNDREHEEIRKYAVEDLAGEMVTVRDMLEDAIDFEDLAPDTENRLRMVIAQFDKVLTSGSIERIEPEQGESYDNDLHRMADKVRAKSHDENDIVRVLEIGYRTHDRVIRPASVQVAAGGSE